MGALSRLLQAFAPPQRPNYGRDASTLRVRVTYRVKGQRAVTTREMAHNEYIDWAMALAEKKSQYELVHAEQIRPRD